MPLSRRAFTLIELLVVIAIIAILSVVVLLTLNPAQLLMQSRDSNRVSDMSTLNSALGIYSAQGGISLGSSNVVYVSIPDPMATSTAGDQCQGLGLISLPLGYTYQCAASSTYRLTNGTGWIPVNFASMAAGSPLSILPIDPAQSSSSRLYYTYTTNGSQYEITANMESAKYQLGGSNDVIGNDGGTLASVYEKGSKLGLEPLDYGDNSLVGLWTFNEGSSSVAYDYSGNNATGSWNGTPVGTNGYYSVNAKIGSYAAAFDGSTDYVGVLGTNNLPLGNNPRSVFAWVYWTGLGTGSPMIYTYGRAVTGQFAELTINSISSVLYFRGYADDFQPTFVVTQSTWHFVGYVYAGGTSMTLYYDGQTQTGSLNGGISLNTILSGSPNIGKESGYNNYFQGFIDDVRVYNRALTAAQVAAMYAGGK